MLIKTDHLKAEQQQFVEVFTSLLQQSNALLGIVNQEGDFLFTNLAFQKLFPSSNLKTTNESLSKPVAKRMKMHVEKTFQKQVFLSYTDHLDEKHPERLYAVFCFPIQNKQQVTTSIGLIIVDSEHFDWLTEKLLAKANSTIEELKKQIESIQIQAITDPLTGVWNRTQAEIIGKQEIAKHQRSGKPFSLIFIDLDNFKSVNDTWGHHIGDLILTECCRATEKILRSFDMLARWGGEEFIVLLPDTHFKDAHLVANRICQTLAQHSFEHVGNMTASLGVASHRLDEPWGLLVERADSAMYQAKTKGKNRVEPTIDNMDQHVTQLEQSTSFLRLVWSKSFECGHPTIDNQHRQLFTHANSLFFAFLEGKENAHINLHINGLITAVATHFSDEIQILREVHYPDVDEHEKIHHDIVEKALMLVKQYENDELKLGDLFSFLAYDVVAMHMLQEDQKFSSYVKKTK